MSLEDCREFLIMVGGFLEDEVKDVEVVLEIIFNINFDVFCEIEGEEGV